MPIRPGVVDWGSMYIGIYGSPMECLGIEDVHIVRLQKNRNTQHKIALVSLQNSQNFADCWALFAKEPPEVWKELSMVLLCRGHSSALVLSLGRPHKSRF